MHKEDSHAIDGIFSHGMRKMSASALSKNSGSVEILQGRKGGGGPDNQSKSFNVGGQ